jgi:hypothetical protein
MQEATETADSKAANGSLLPSACLLLVRDGGGPLGDVVGPNEIFPFLGSSCLEDPLNRYRITACFHGHAHHGKPEGKTSSGIPVYNVALPVLRQAYPEQPFRVLEVNLEAKHSS